ncbi:hypothetical protein G9O61_00g020820 [Vairimorpha ceranae]|nr:hypothetical protein G9O61_00g022020 [Vairimorpha ceranae]KAF5139768.1 hypothetical protein G9O61_00g020820 [Vairimorpha ceranae]
MNTNQLVGCVQENNSELLFKIVSNTSAKTMNEWFKVCRKIITIKIDGHKLYPLL